MKLRRRGRGQLMIARKYRYLLTETVAGRDPNASIVCDLASLHATMRLNININSQLAANSMQSSNNRSV